MLDSVSAERLSCYGYDRQTTPNIDLFSERATQYDTAIANSSWTVPVHGTLFTGAYPSEHGANAKHKELSVPADRTLAGQLSQNGYRTVGLSTNPWVATDFGYDTGFDEFEDVRPQLPFDTARPQELYQRLDEGNYWGSWRSKYEALRWALEGNPITRMINVAYDRRQKNRYATADELNKKALSWIDDNEERPFFMFLNYMDAHEPYNPDTEYISKFRDESCSVDVDWHLKSLGHSHSEAELDCVNDQYDACLNYLDYQISLLLDGLEDRDILNETVVVLTADHGKCLGEHGYLGVGTYLYDELIEVPLIISHQRESESYLPTEYVSQIDIHSMILQTAGIETESNPIDGVISETLGPHQDVDKSDHYVPKEGLRRIDHRGYTLVEDQHTKEEQTRDSIPENVREEMMNLIMEQKQNREIINMNSEAKEITDDVKKHLEELGYR